MKFPHIEWQWAITAAVAIYGALLSTYNAYVARKQNRTDIRVTVKYGFFTSGPTLSDQVLFVEASNPGRRAITLTSVGVVLPTKQQLVITTQGSYPLPHNLTEGTSISHWISLREMSDIMRANRVAGTVKLRGFYNDAVGARHYSERFSFNLDEQH